LRPGKTKGRDKGDGYTSFALWAQARELVRAEHGFDMTPCGGTTSMGQLFYKLTKCRFDTMSRER
jgi:hypothetical protein